jgi:hypothetical protein
VHGEKSKSKKQKAESRNWRFKRRARYFAAAAPALLRNFLIRLRTVSLGCAPFSIQ